jgi:hypothetical protein
MPLLIRQPQSGMLTDARQTRNVCDPDGSPKVRRSTWKYLASGCSRALVFRCRVNGRCANFPDCCLNAHVSPKRRFSANYDRAPPVYQPSTSHVTDGWSGEKAFGDSNTHRQHGPRGNAMPGLRMFIMAFNLDRGGRDDCVDVLLLRCTAVCLAGTGHWISAKLELRAINEPRKYWSRPVWLLVFGSFAGLRLFVAASGSFLSVGPTYQTKSALHGARARSR